MATMSLASMRAWRTQARERNVVVQELLDDRLVSGCNQRIDLVVFFFHGD
jgi:hypothetical protein